MLESLDSAQVGATMAGVLAFGAGIARWWRVERLHKTNTESSVSAIKLWRDLADRALAQVDAANARAAAAQAMTDSILEQSRKDREEDRKRITELTASVRELQHETATLVGENRQLKEQITSLRLLVRNGQRDETSNSVTT